MILDFAIFYFMFWWIMSIITKDNFIQNKISNLSKKVGGFAGRKLNSLSMCMFCIENHTATVMAIGYAYYCLDVRVLIWGFLCASINSWLREFFQ